jgi:hypothetical protein
MIILAARSIEEIPPYDLGSIIVQSYTLTLGELGDFESFSAP